jgi:hypothetical protein
MSFQPIIDNASSISINRKKKVAQTVSRDGTVKATSLGGQTWEFEVRLPDGPRWEDYRSIIEEAESLDRVSTGEIRLNNPGFDWLVPYRGNLPNTADVLGSPITVSYTSGNTVTITNGGTGLTSGQFKFRSGDLIQLGSSGRVYSVVYDVAHNGTVITLNRPVREAAGSYTILVGRQVVWTVICAQFPQWTIFERNQISWSGPFIFAEVV